MRESARHSFVGLCPACEKRYRNTAAQKQRRGSRLTLAQKFCFKVRLPVDPAGCWEWAGGIGTQDYGFMRVGNTTTSAHRVAYELFVGPIPEKYTIDHLCRNRGCVNPDHLEAVPHQVNCRRGSATKRVA